MSEVTLEHIDKRYGRAEVLKDISLHIPDGSFTILLGPSGCGKSTLLRIIAGLEKNDAGQVLIGGRDVTRTPPGERDVAMVFQNYALYPHLTVYQNIEYGLKARGVKKAEREELVAQAVAMVRLEDQVKKLPANMSGGQRQRVALARAIVKRPNIFLMDEPLSNLDAKLRSEMRFELIELYERLGATFLYVTHDQVEAMSMGTHIVVLNQGEIQQRGSPREIYEKPQNVFVAGFIGSPPANLLRTDYAVFAVRPEHIRTDETAEPHIALPGQIVSSEHLGNEALYSARTIFGQMRFRMENTWDGARGRVILKLPVDRIVALNASGSLIEDAEVRERLIAALNSTITESAACGQQEGIA
jgi:sn-glycerol 3-phosphate transport system ATP-binding protein